ncbi:MAG TPA: PQQ-dependent sugar dehydrogenase, partial [Beijerinckiaceae bacterium]
MPFRSAARRLALVSLATAWAGAAAAQAPARLESSAGPIRVETVARGLAHPWAIAPLPDGALLVTERPGRLRVVSAKGEASAPVRGTPQVFARGQGGLLDVALAPSFSQDRTIYLTYAEPGEGGRAGTALARARLSEDRTSLQDLRVVFRQEPKVDGAQHFGSRIVFARDGSIFVGLGERGKFDPSQDLRSHLGKVIRIRPDGAAPQDNPFIGKPDVRPEI